VCQRHYADGQMVRLLGPDAVQSIGAMASGDMDVDLDIKIETTTSLPFDRERKKQDAEKLFAAIGPPYLPELLEAYEVPNAPEVLARVKVWQAIQQVMAQQEETGSGTQTG